MMLTNEQLLQSDGYILVVGFDQYEVDQRMNEIKRIISQEHHLMGINGKVSELKILQEKFIWTRDEKFTEITGFSIFGNPSFLFGKHIDTIEYSQRVLSLKYLFNSLEATLEP